MISTILGTKKEMSQRFTASGKRIPITKIQAGPCVVVQIKSDKNDGYQAVQLGIGQKKKKNISKPLTGHLKETVDKKSGPRFLREVRLLKDSELKVGDKIKVDQIIKPGDLVNITGKTKGKGFTGVMKRWGFSGGPRSHGQSDRQRAPGSIGQTTTPGRVFKGKKMPGRSGNATHTIRNLIVVKVLDSGEIWVKGQVPGARNGLLSIKKVSEAKFEGLWENENPKESQDTSPSNVEKKKVKDKPKEPENKKE